MAHTEHTSPEDKNPAQRVALDDWLEALAEHLGLDDVEVPTAELLDAARVIAHGVARPAAPLSTFLLGVAAARSDGTPEAMREVAARATELAHDWSAKET